MSAAERASEASSAEQANEWAVRANERANEQMAQYLVGVVEYTSLSQIITQI